MKTAHAPSELPFVPKPYNNELSSSWMLRIAHANCVSLQELVLGFQCRHPDLSIPDPLDWGFSPAYLKAMARFSRTPVSKLHLLDLRTRLQRAEHALLLSFRNISHQRERLRSRRMSGGNFRLLARLLTQIERVLSVNDLHVISTAVVEAARDSLVIRLG